MTERLSDRLKEYLETARGRVVNLRDIRAFLQIEPGSKADQNLRTQMATTMVTQKLVKPSGLNDANYKVLLPVEPVKWWNGNDAEPLSFKFPRSYGDGSEFGIEECAEVFAGDMILITGDTNFGKTAIALSIMGENLNLFPNTLLMGSEYTANDNKISPKFKRRMRRMDWVEWMVDGKPKFTLLPIGADYEDYIESDWQNIIDWISLPGEYYLIDRVMKAMKDRTGNGVVTAVLQKNKGQEFAEGGQRSERYADVVLKIDPYGEKESMLTLGKVKAPKGRATGRMWAFSIVDHGANLHNIREIVKCSKCWGKGYLRSGNNNARCPLCQGKKYVDMYDV